jgi:23S rRNA (uracil1939-C5)-methyltransferase
VFDNLTRIGKVPLPEIMPIIGSKEDRYYRNKLEYTFSTKEYIPRVEFDAARFKEITEAAGQNALGFHAKGFVFMQKAFLIK